MTKHKHFCEGCGDFWEHVEDRCYDPASVNFGMFGLTCPDHFYSGKHTGSNATPGDEVYFVN